MAKTDLEKCLEKQAKFFEEVENIQDTEGNDIFFVSICKRKGKCKWQLMQGTQIVKTYGPSSSHSYAIDFVNDYRKNNVGSPTASILVGIAKMAHEAGFKVNMCFDNHNQEIEYHKYDDSIGLDCHAINIFVKNPSESFWVNFDKGKLIINANNLEHTANIDLNDPNSLDNIGSIISLPYRHLINKINSVAATYKVLTWDSLDEVKSSMNVCIQDGRLCYFGDEF